MLLLSSQKMPVTWIKVSLNRNVPLADKKEKYIILLNAICLPT